MSMTYDPAMTLGSMLQTEKVKNEPKYYHLQARTQFYDPY